MESLSEDVSRSMSRSRSDEREREPPPAELRTRDGGYPPKISENDIDGRGDEHYSYKAVYEEKSTRNQAR